MREVARSVREPARAVRDPISALGNKMAVFGMVFEREGRRWTILPPVVGIIEQGQPWDESDPHVVCPWHGFEYSIKTERHQTSPSVAAGSIA